ncbi:MAG: hypothetical protein V4562_12155 [Pseudomonadota bacterium]
MPRLLKTREEIQAEVHRLVHLDPKVREAKVNIEIPLPLEMDPMDGCNWAMSSYRNSTGHMDAVAKAVSEVMDKWNLKV